MTLIPAFSNLYPYVKRLPLMGRLLAGRSAPVRDPRALPRKIYIFWDSGLDTAPEMVRFCVNSWIRMNPGWEVIFLDQAAADAFVLRSALPSTLRPAAYADILRIKILSQHGGVWADATCLCTRPLDGVLPLLFCQCDFFAFHRPGSDRLIASWFLAAAKDSAPMKGWDRLVEDFWKTQTVERCPYFWCHYLFEYLILRDPAARRAWRHTPKLDAAPPHALQRYLLGQDLDGRNLEYVRHGFVQKLSYKADFTVQDVKDTLAKLHAPDIT